MRGQAAKMQRTDREIVNSRRQIEAEIDDAEVAVDVATERLGELSESLGHIEREWLQSHKCSCGLLGLGPCDH